LKTPAVASTVLAPKVAGTQALADAIGESPLDFFVLCSSTASVLGGAGQVDYCAANAYLDAFANDYAKRTGTFTVAVNWDAWQEVGMAVDTATAVPDALARHRAAMLSRGIRPEEGVDAFARILERGASSQIAVLTVGLRALRGLEAPEVGAPTRYTRPELSVEYSAPTNELESAICNIWIQLLGLERVGVHDDFFELGGHSLLATQLASRLRQALDIDLSLADIFEAPSIAGLAELFMARLLEQEERSIAGRA
jgi:acyl carrier protein